MKFEEAFNKFKGEFINTDITSIKENLAFQFNIIGEGEGVFYAVIRDGKLLIEPYEYLDRDVLFIAEFNTFRDIAKGKLDPIKAFFQGKLKVEGNYEKASALKVMIKKKK